jgi:23S rRNA pseudouridine1911/1915/1917 synthase
VPLNRKTIYFTITINENKRLDVYLSEKISDISRSKIYNLIKKGDITINNSLQKAGYILKKGDIVKVTIPEPLPSKITAEKIPLEILYEDDYYIAVNKPAGMVVHPGAGNFYGTLVNALVNYASKLSSVGGSLRPGLVHRLDKDTSGIVIAAKTDEAHWKLSDLFSKREVYKEYCAFVWGVPKLRSGIVNVPIGRSSKNGKKFVVDGSGKIARTRYEVINSFDIISSVKLILETGRTHQARVHMNYIGNPVVGDLVYGGGVKHLYGFSKKEVDLGRQVLSIANRQMLHAYKIRFLHPFTSEELEIEAPFPEDIKRVETILKSKSSNL